MSAKEFEMQPLPHESIGSRSPGTESFNDTASNSNLVMREPERAMWCGCLSVAFYKRFFNVDTRDVKDRWLRTILPCRRNEPFLTLVGDNADAYGPFWNATTLVFFIALTTNVNSWIAFKTETHDDASAAWEYDFTKLVTSTSIVYGFTAAVPFLGWLAFGQLDIKLPLVHHLCIYGYALAPFIPAVLLCMVPVEVVVWVSLACAALLSIVFLLRTLTPLVLEHHESANCAAGAMAAYASAQIALMLLFKFLFYNSSS